MNIWKSLALFCGGALAGVVLTVKWLVTPQTVINNKIGKQKTNGRNNNPDITFDTKEEPKKKFKLPWRKKK